MTEGRLKEIKYLMDINQVNPTIVKELLSEVLKVSDVYSQNA